MPAGIGTAERHIIRQARRISSSSPRAGGRPASRTVPLNGRWAGDTASGQGQARREFYFHLRLYRIVVSSSMPTSLAAVMEKV